jgi:general secretion pathway protein J
VSYGPTPHYDSRDNDGEAGFTLVEVLVSMFIFSLISLGALIALTTTLDARERSEARIEQVERLAAARRLMADDFRTMTLRQNRDGLGGFIETLDLNPVTNQIDITRRGRPNPEGVFARGDLSRVSWRVEDGQLIRSFLPHENPAYVEPPIDRVILDGVESMAFALLRAPDLSDGIGETMKDFDGGPIVTGFAPEQAPQINGADRAAIDILLTHADQTTTRYFFEFTNAQR